MPAGSFSKIIASLTALATLLASVECSCASATAGADEVSSQPPAAAMELMPCCGRDCPMGHRCSGQRQKDGSQPIKPCCEHCQRTAINDSSITPRHGSSFQPLPFTIAANPNLLAWHPVVSAGRPLHLPLGSLPPPIASATLFALHCALTT